MERDTNKPPMVKRLIISTHTLTWSVTLGAGRLRLTDRYFNSHAHVERDSALTGIAEIKEISTHTLTWSVTQWIVEIPSQLHISTHTLTWSVTP